MLTITKSGGVEHIWNTEEYQRDTQRRKVSLKTKLTYNIKKVYYGNRSPDKTKREENNRISIVLLTYSMWPGIAGAEMYRHNQFVTQSQRPAFILWNTNTAIENNSHVDLMSLKERIPCYVLNDDKEKDCWEILSRAWKVYAVNLSIKILSIFLKIFS